jgi:hypothetical protein
MRSIALLLATVSCGVPGDPDASGDDSAAVTTTCEDVYQVTTAGMPADPTGDLAGYDHCWADGSDGLGWVNRTEAVTCATDARTLIGACTTSEDDADCATDADCGGGFCGESHDWWQEGCTCYDICGEDTDCDASEACVCPAGFTFDAGGGYHSFGSFGECLPAECRTGADCPSGECGVSWTCCGQGGDAVGLYCRSDADECSATADCDGGRVCQWDGSRFSCFGSCDCE